VRPFVVVLGSCRSHRVPNFCQEHLVLSQYVFVSLKYRVFVNLLRTSTTSLYLGSTDRIDLTIGDDGVYSVVKKRR